jgi:RHS repeat-associated protein
MPEGNPLVAAPVETTNAVTGIGLAESCVDVANGVSNGDWVEAGLGVLGAGLEVLSLVIDPLGTLASYGVSWLIEHVRPLKEALDWFAGDPPVIRSFSETWANVAAEVDGVSQDLMAEASSGTSGWRGAAGDAYRGHATEAADAVAGAGALASGISAGVMIMGEVVAFVREFIRDLVGELVGRLISWALEVAATLGLATPLVVAQATAAISKVVNKVADLVRKLVKTIGNVAPRIRKIISKLDEIIEKLRKLLRRADGSTTPSGTTSPARHAGDPPTTHGADGTPHGGDTSPAGTDPNGAGPSGAHSPDQTKPGSTDNGGSNRPDNPNDTRTPENRRRCENDPIDVATGEMVLAQADVELPGVLPLVLSRTQLSSYRAGLSFGRSWASTVDQRLEFDEQGVVFIGDDGMILVYPDPPVRGEVLPEVGPRWPLRRTETGFAIRRRGIEHTLHFPAGTTRNCPLGAIEDRNGNRIDVDRDGTGTPVAVRHSGGYHIDIASTEGRIVELRLRNGQGGHIPLVRYTYESGGQLSEVVNSSGRALRFDYDRAGRITQWTDRNGHWYRYFYDERGRCVANQGSGGFLNGTFSYDDENRTTRFTDALGHPTSYQLDATARVVAETNALRHTATQEWDDHDRLVSRTDALGRTTRCEYDGAGNLVTVTRPDGSQTRTEYDGSGQPTVVVNPDGSVWRQEYDDRGNLVAAVDPAGAITRFGHDDRGHRVSVTDALGNVRRIETNPAGLPVAVTDATGATTRYTVDPMGRVVAITDPMGGVTRFSWTVEGRLLSRTRPDGTTERWSYDGQGNEVRHVDPLGRTRRMDTTHFALPTVEIGPDGARTEFGYDAALRLVSVTNPQGLVWRYEYDAAGHLVREIDFNGRDLRYRRDAAGQLIERINGVGQTVTLTRDRLGNIVERRCGAARTTIEYDGAGRLVRARNADAELVYQRDALGQVVAETVNGATVTSAHDPLGRRVYRRTPTGAESRWDFDANARPTLLRTAGRELAFGYNPAGREVRRLLDTGVALDQEWDVNQRLATQAVAVAGHAPIQHRRYSYTGDGYVAAVDELLGGLRRYELDVTGRVGGVESVDRRERYGYDRAGNITAAGWPGDAEAQGARQYSGTLVRAAGGIRYEHDGQGRVVLRQRKRLSRKPDTWYYEWDPDDRLVGVTTPDGTRWRYLHDPLGRRIAKLRLAADGSAAERTDFVWDGTVLVEQIHSSGQATTWEFDPASYRPLTQVERRRTDQEWVDRQFYAIVTDLVGTPTELLDAQGNLAWRAQTSLWGELIARSGQAGYTPLRFPGQYHDLETGLHHNYLRVYDPTTGRYASGDPLGLIGGLGPHSYVHNPVSWTDALGLTESSDIEWVDAGDVNFSQRTVSPNDYAEAMANGEWDWERSPLRVMEVDGQLVSYDNRRLDAAREVGGRVAIQRVDPDAPHPDSTTGRTWRESFQRRFRSARNRGSNGEPVPDNGLSERPRVECGGGRRRRGR